MGRPKLVNVWELRLNLPVAIAETELEDLESAVKGKATREFPLPLVWQRQGAVLTVRTQGDVFLLIEITEWALLNLSSSPTGFSVTNKRIAQLDLTEGRGWNGHGGV